MLRKLTKRGCDVKELRILNNLIEIYTEHIPRNKENLTKVYAKYIKRFARGLH